ncbi:MAG: hypothetical protein AB7I34_11145 [Rhizobiaceae bacterium]
MDWNAAIERHREALKRILVTLFAMAGVISGSCSETKSPGFSSEGTPEPTLPRHLHRAILRLLRPAESAARRLIIAAARSIVLPPPLTPPHKGEGDSPTSPPSSPPPCGEGSGVGVRLRVGAKTGRPPTLPLFDPLPSPSRPRRPTSTSMPRISFPGYAVPFVIPVRHPPSPNDPLDAARLVGRLQALAAALDDLPRHARRFARWRTRRDAQTPRAQTGRRRFRRIWPLRGGRPPGGHNARRRARPVDDVLKAAHGLAFWSLENPDTS